MTVGYTVSSLRARTPQVPAHQDHPTTSIFRCSTSKRNTHASSASSAPSSCPLSLRAKAYPWILTHPIFLLYPCTTSHHHLLTSRLYALHAACARRTKVKARQPLLLPLLPRPGLGKPRGGKASASPLTRGASGGCPSQLTSPPQQANCHLLTPPHAASSSRRHRRYRHLSSGRIQIPT